MSESDRMSPKRSESFLLPPLSPAWKILQHKTTPSSQYVREEINLSLIKAFSFWDLSYINLACSLNNAVSLGRYNAKSEIAL
jgi:hypothetical protein